jgi:hypothetical protein
MKIKTQILLAVVPIFISIPVITGIVFFLYIRAEMEGGLTDVANALTRSSVAFLEKVDSDQTARSELQMTQSKLQSYLHQIVRRNKLLGLQLVSLDSGDLIYANGTQYEDLQSALETINIAKKSGDPSRNIRFFPDRKNEKLTAVSWPFSIGSDPEIKVMVTTLSSERIAEVESRIILYFSGFTVICLAASLGVASLLSRILSKRITQLVEHAFSSINRVDPTATISGGWVREIEDLGNTFDVMISVVRNDLQRTRKSLLENHIFSDDEMLARFLRENYFESIQATLGSLNVAAGTTSSRSFGDFWQIGVNSSEGISFALIGEAAQSQPLQEAISAYIAGRVLGVVMAAEGFEWKKIGQCIEALQLQSVIIAVWESDGKSMKIVRLSKLNDQMDTMFTKQSILRLDERTLHDYHINSSELLLSENSYPIILSTAATFKPAAIAQITHRFPTVSIETVLDCLAEADTPSGAYIIIQNPEQSAQDLEAKTL